MRPPALTAAAAFIVGQSLALGLQLAFLVVPGNAVFLSTYGAERLPYVYLIVAVCGAVVSWGLTALQSRFELFHLALASTLVVASLTFASWMVLAFGGGVWASFGVLVIFAMQLQLGFVFIGAQAGRAFDVQELKRVFSWVVAAFVVGFMVGGFIAARFAAIGGEPVHLLALSTVVAVAIAVLTLGAARHARAPVHEPYHPRDAEADRAPSIRRVLAVPLVGAVFVYQVLSAIVTQLIEYLVYDRAAARFTDAQALARFIGQYSAILNLVDLVVLVAFGGLLMSRYGLRYGLSSNPIIVTGLVIAAVVVAFVAGPGHTAFFVLIAIARIADITTTDAAGRTAINATFKALPSRQRLTAQVGVEAAGVPIALGLTALMILAINALPGESVTEVTIATLVLGIVWCGMSWVVYRRYRAAVVVAARRRVLDGEIVALGEPTTRDALAALLRSDDPRDVEVALSLLGGGSDLAAPLRDAAASPSLTVRKAVAGRLVDLDPSLAGRIAEDLIRSPHPAHRLDGIRLAGRLAGAVDPALLQPFLADPDPVFRAAAIGTLLRIDGDGPDLRTIIAEAARAPEAADRLFAARAIAEAGSVSSPETLVALLGDGDPAVRNEASAAVAALADDQRFALLASPMGHRETVRFLRACRSSASEAFCARIASLLDADRPETSEMVRLLNAAGWQAKTEGERAAIDRLVDGEVARIATARTWIDAIGNADPAFVEPTARLRRALAQEAAVSGRHLIDLLGLLYDRRLMTRTGRVLQGTTAGDAGLSLESLDVMLSPRHRTRLAKALRTAFDPTLAARPTAGKEGTASADTLLALARDCRWAVRQDWLLASALALLDHMGVSPAARTGITPLGPISAELMAPR